MNTFVRLLLNVFGAFLLGVFIGILFTESHYQHQAVERNCAQYNPSTGDFQWSK